MRELVSTLLPALLCACAGAPPPLDDAEVLRRFFAAYDAGDLTAALDALEPAFADHYIETGYHDGTSNTEQLLARTYERAGELDRGVAYLRRVYRAKVLAAPGGRPESHHSVEENLFDLALLANAFDVADEVMTARTRREDYPGWDLDRARLHAARGDTAAALATLASYLRYDLADSRTQILVRREFRPLHGDDAFRRLMTETPELAAARRAARRDEQRRDAELMGETPRRDATAAEFRAAFDVFAKMTDPAQREELAGELRAAHEIIAPNVERLRADALDLLRAVNKNAAYRLAVAFYLLSIEDPDTTKAVAAAVKDDSFTNFLEQLFTITLAIAGVDAAAARPFLLQLLSGTGATIAMPEHAMSIGGDALLVQAFGRVELHYVDELLRQADGGDAQRRDKATLLLVSFGEPRVVPVLVRAFAAATDAGGASRVLRLLAAVRVPEAKAALQQIAAGPRTTDTEKALIGELVAQLPPEATGGVPDARLAIVDPAMRTIFFDNLVLTNGADVSFVGDVLRATATPADIPRLRAIRAAVFGRMSDEAIGDWETVSEIITQLRWQ